MGGPGGHERLGQRLERPPLALGLGGLARIRGTRRHPRFEQGHFFRRQGLLWRHLVVGVGPAHHSNQETFLRLSWHDRRTGVAALFPTGLGIQSQAALHLSGRVRMTFQAMLFEERLDVRGEQVFGLG